MRILVTGANGQVGHELLRALVDIAQGAGPSSGPAGHLLPVGEGMLLHPSPERTGWLLSPSPSGRGAGVRVRTREIIPATRDGTLADGTPCERVDLADPDGLASALDRITPDLIINAAAYTAVDRAEDEPELAQRVNADAVGVIGAWAAQHDARVVHYSTDYVFAGSASRPYREDDPTHPLGVYGRSKLDGEIALQDSGARYLLFRTAWVYAARGHNFLRTMLRLGAERDELRVVDDQVGAPTPAGLIADVTALAIARWYLPSSEGRGAMRSSGGMLALDGTYHLVADGQTSWCGFARAIFERAVRAGSHPPQSPFLRKGEEVDTPFAGGGAGGELHPLSHERSRALSGASLAAGDVDSESTGLDHPLSHERSRALAGASIAAGDVDPESTGLVHPLPQEGGRREAPGGCPRVIAISTGDYPTKAARPAYSVLDTSKLRAAFGITLPDWQVALDTVMGELAVDAEAANP